MGIFVPESAVVAVPDSQDFLATTSTTVPVQEGQPAGQDENTGAVVLRTRYRGLSWDKKHQRYAHPEAAMRIQDS